MNQCIILNYHAIAEHHTAHDPIYAVEEAVFRQQMEIIKRLGLVVTPLAQIARNDLGNSPKVVISFDDGHASDIDLAYPILQEYGWKAAFFVPTHKLANQPETVSHYQKLAADGHHIGPHGVTHRYLSDLDAEQQWHELDDSKTLIEQLFLTEARFCALPGGKYNKCTLHTAQQLGFKHLLTTQFGFCATTHPPFLLNRWTVKRNTSLLQFENILRGNRMEIWRASKNSLLKKTIQKILPNQLIDNLNYRIHK